MEKISIVTISYNQAKFLEQAICSVIDQDYLEIEYIVVDPGSTDGSREIIEKYRDRIDKIIFEPDDGPADGLNKGFSYATGDVYGFLNADDYFLPGAFKRVIAAFLRNRDKHVMSGHTIIVDDVGCPLRKFYSRKFALRAAVYGASTLAQQSTFFLAQTFHGVKGFNMHNPIAWDGELWIDMALSGARFGLINDFLSVYRIYSSTISLNGHSYEERFKYDARMFQKVCGRPKRNTDTSIKWLMKVYEYLSDLRILRERVLRGHALRLRRCCTLCGKSRRGAGL